MEPQKFLTQNMKAMCERYKNQYRSYLMTKVALWPCSFSLLDGWVASAAYFYGRKVLKNHRSCPCMRRYDTQHNDTQHNDTQHEGLISDIQHSDTQHNYTQHNNTRPLWRMSLCWAHVIMLNVIMLNVRMLNVLAPLHTRRVGIYQQPTFFLHRDLCIERTYMRCHAFHGPDHFTWV
jgi:hypothetical protein